MRVQGIDQSTAEDIWKVTFVDPQLLLSAMFYMRFPRRFGNFTN